MGLVLVKMPQSLKDLTKIQPFFLNKHSAGATSFWLFPEFWKILILTIFASFLQKSLALPLSQTLYFFFEYWVNSPIKLSGPEILFIEMFLITDSVSLLVVDLFRFSIYLWFTLGSYMFLGISLFILGCPVCWHIIVNSCIFWFFVFLWLSVEIDLSFLILLIEVLPHFLLVSLAEGFSILFIFSWNKLFHCPFPLSF